MDGMDQWKGSRPNSFSPSPLAGVVTQGGAAPSVTQPCVVVGEGTPCPWCGDSVLQGRMVRHAEVNEHCRVENCQLIVCPACGTWGEYGGSMYRHGTRGPVAGPRARLHRLLH